MIVCHRNYIPHIYLIIFCEEKKSDALQQKEKEHYNEEGKKKNNEKYVDMYMLEDIVMISAPMKASN